MGEHHITAAQDERHSQLYMKALLNDLAALEQMLEVGRLENGLRRIGAEQEMFLVDEAMRPAPVAPALLKSLDEPRLTTEMATFNLEANLSPRPFAGDCLSVLEQELRELLALTQQG